MWSSNLIEKLPENKSDNKHSYFLGGVEMIANDVIDFVKNDILIFSLSVILIIILVLFFIFQQIKWVIICLLSSSYSVTLIDTEGNETTFECGAD